MRKILTFLFLSIFLIGMINAEDDGSLLNGKQYNCINLPQECASCSYVNLTTITNPDLSQQSIQSIMTKYSTSFNYSFCNTSQLGDYSFCMVGDVDGIPTSVCKDFEITTTGKPSQIKIPLFLILCSLVLFVIGVFLKNNELLFLSGIFFMITGVYFMIYGLSDFADMYTRTIGGILIAFGAIVGVSSAYEFLYEGDSGDSESE